MIYISVDWSTVVEAWAPGGGDVVVDQLGGADALVGLPGGKIMLG